MEYKVTLKINSFCFEAEDKEQAEQAFWDLWHNDRGSLDWELVIEGEED
jgi:hypothetical protein